MKKYCIHILISVFIIALATLSISANRSLNKVPENTQQKTHLITPSPIPSPNENIDPHLVDNNFVKRYYRTLEFTTKNNNTIKNYYSPYVLGCAGHKRTNILTNDLKPFLEAVGSTSQKQIVFVLSRDMQYPGVYSNITPSKNRNLLPENLRYYGDPIQEDDWQEFLLNQYIDYPLIIIENEQSKHIIYKRHNYVYVPGC